jgi:hypothetical protein
LQKAGEVVPVLTRRTASVRRAKMGFMGNLLSIIPRNERLSGESEDPFDF